LSVEAAAASVFGTEFVAASLLFVPSLVRRGAWCSIRLWGGGCKSLSPKDLPHPQSSVRVVASFSEEIS